MNLNFAENFKRLRKEKGLTQEKVAEVLEVSSQAVSRWELSICYPDLELLPSIANYFGVTIDQLLSNDAQSKDKDIHDFVTTVRTLSDETTQRIDFVRNYCRKYPENDFFAYHLVLAIRDHVLGDEVKTNKYMELLLSKVQRLMETKYRSVVIQVMVAVCNESELSKWLDMCPYSVDFNRRGCLVYRSGLRGDTKGAYVQQGLEMLESMANQLDRRCPDTEGAPKKVLYQSQVLATVASFGKQGEIPDGWKLFYAYKQLVLAACLFGCGQTEEGWENFNHAITLCKYVYGLEDEWLEIGGELFANIRVSKDWNQAIDEEGRVHKLFGIVNLSFYNAKYIFDLLTNPRWAWFDPVRDSHTYQEAVACLREVCETQKAKS